MSETHVNHGISLNPSQNDASEKVVPANPLPWLIRSLILRQRGESHSRDRYPAPLTPTNLPAEKGV